MDLELSERGRNRIANHKKYLSMIHPATQMSEPCARALKEHNISVPAMALYESMSEAEILDVKSGAQRSIRPMDTNHGTLCNGLTSIPKEIGNLVNMQYFMVANSTLKELPAELAKCYSLTDIEIYNCPQMTKFPMSITRLPALISLNLSNNKQWSAEEVYKGLDSLAQGPSKKSIQLLYARENSLEEVPESFKNMHSLSLLDLAYNKISKIHPLTKEVGLVQLYLDHNELESIPTDESGYFCAIDDVETFSVTYNKLKKVPNIFSAKSKYTMSTVDFSANQIDGFEGEDELDADGNMKYKGMRVETLTLTQNNLHTYPTAIAKTNSYVAYIIMRANKMTEMPDEAFEYKNSVNLVSLDLSYNELTKMPDKFHAGNMPYLYGVDLSFNSFSDFPFEPLDARSLTVFAIRSQRGETGERCLKEWPTGLYNHTGLRGFYIGSNDLRKVDDTISTLIYYLDISDNPRIVFDASDICSAWMAGAYYLIYDKTQNIQNCDYMLE
jgi:Leucine-rich repeat (LRR) protein